MNRERTEPNLQHDFATITNPLGESPLIKEKATVLGPVCQEQLLMSLASYLQVEPSNIMLAKGSDEIIQQLPGLCLAAEDVCVLPTPTYFSLRKSLAANNNRIIQVNCRPQKKFAFDKDFEDEIIQTIRKVQPRLVWLCSPNNPTGEIMSPELIEKVVKATPGLVVVDEAYQEMVDPLNEHSAIKFLSWANNLLVTKTFSKAFGLPQIRVGFAVGSREVIEKLKLKVQPLSDLSVQIAEAALLDKKHLAHSAEFIKLENTFLSKEIIKLENIEFGSESRTSVYLLRHRRANLFNLLKDAGIETLDYNKEPGLEGLGFVRVGLRSHKDNLRLLEVLRRLDKFPVDDSHFLLERVIEEEKLKKVYDLMSTEFISRGGRLRDFAMPDLMKTAWQNGQVWATLRNDMILAAFTVQEVMGEHGKWLYLNNGVVSREHRHQGGQIMEKLIKSAISGNQAEVGVIVISIASGIFLRSGFKEVSLKDLSAIDSQIGEIIRQKIRPNDPTKIFIKV